MVVVWFFYALPGNLTENVPWNIKVNCVGYTVIDLFLR